VVRTALTNAGSIASLMLTTETLVAEIPEKKEAPWAAAATAVAVWKACTKTVVGRRSLVVGKVKGPARESGAFFCPLRPATPPHR